MKFNEKLDFLLKITGVTNNSLARAVSLDSSYISRLRSGARIPSTKQNYIGNMAIFFSKQINSEYKKNALFSIIKIDNTLDYSKDELKKIIEAWLLDEREKVNETVDNFLNNFSSTGFKINPKDSILKENPLNSTKETSITPLFGIDDEIEAIYNILHIATLSEKKVTLYFLYDKNIAWIREKKDFMKKISNLLTSIVENGNKIKIIQSVSRNIDEILLVLELLLPSYLLGCVETYYYPRFKDGLFNQVMIILENNAAIISTSIVQNKIENISYYITEKKIINNLNQQFKAYLDMCIPLLRVITEGRREKHFKTVLDFDEAYGNCVVKTDMLTSLTMPSKVFKSMLERINVKDKVSLEKDHLKRVLAFQSNLDKNYFQEIICIPQLEVIRQGKAEINLFHEHGCNNVCYTTEEFCLHLRSVIDYLRKYKNYSINIIEKGEIPEGIIYVKEGVGVLIWRNILSNITVAVNDIKMTNAFLQYMCYKTFTYDNAANNRINTINRLERIIEELEYN